MMSAMINKDPDSDYDAARKEEIEKEQDDYFEAVEDKCSSDGLKIHRKILSSL